jgi:predicted DNA binding CopG/RHH family protein
MDKKTERLQLRLTKQDLMALRILAARKGVGMSDYLSAYIRRNARKAKIV